MRVGCNGGRLGAGWKVEGGGGLRWQSRERCRIEKARRRAHLNRMPSSSEKATRYTGAASRPLARCAGILMACPASLQQHQPPVAYSV